MQMENITIEIQETPKFTNKKFCRVIGEIKFYNSK